MLVVVSPAKKLDMSPLTDVTVTQPRFPEDATKLAKAAGRLSIKGLRDLMHLSEPLAKLNKTRFSEFGEQEKKAAVYEFAGDTYQGFDAATIDEDALSWARIICVFCRAFMVCCAPWMKLSPIVWKWAAI